MRLRGLLAALGLVIACVSVACAPDRGVSQRSATDLEVVSWWTSGSEQHALTVLFDAYRAAHPGATVINGAVAGGGDLPWPDGSVGSAGGRSSPIGREDDGVDVARVPPQSPDHLMSRCAPQTHHVIVASCRHRLAVG